MKLRIKGNSIRIRLNKTEVAAITEKGYVEEQANFGNNKFLYALKRVEEGSSLSATLGNNSLTMLVPKILLKDWPENDTIGFNTYVQVSANESLYLLLEKDFVCLDEPTEDQSDHYQNPNKAC